MMINALHLLWVIPLSATLGMFCTALAVASGRNSRAEEQWEK
jgi:hypothetical protein